jgi:hypothetical protein
MVLFRKEEQNRRQKWRKASYGGQVNSSFITQHRDSKLQLSAHQLLFISKVLFKHSQAHLFMSCLWLFSHYNITVVCPQSLKYLPTAWPFAPKCTHTHTHTHTHTSPR